MKRKWTFILLPGELLSTASGQPCVWSSRCDKIAKRRLGTPEKSRRIVWTIVSLSLVLGVTVQAGEIGHYAGGLVNIRDVIMPPAPGVYAAVYYYYTTDQLNNANGDKISSVNINPGPGPGVTVNVHVDVNIDVIVPILMWVAPPKILGAHYVGFIAPSFADSGLDAACPPRPGVVSEPIPKALGSAICSSNRSGWIGRIIEKHADRQFTVFVSSSPTPMAGAIYILQPERVHPVDVPLTKAMVCVTKWGTGAAEMGAAIHHGKASIDQ